jgi:predicted ABC-type ATPase
MLTAIKTGILKGDSFAFESTLSGKTWLTILKHARSAEYEISIYFISLDNVRENIRRIKTRVAQGGHFVPSETVRRRYPKTFSNFWNIYRTLCKNWFIFNNSGRRPKLIHSAESFAKLSTEQQASFIRKFLKMAKP